MIFRRVICRKASMGCIFAFRYGPMLPKRRSLLLLAGLVARNPKDWISDLRWFIPHHRASSIASSFAIGIRDTVRIGRMKSIPSFWTAQGREQLALRETWAIWLTSGTQN